MHHFQHHCHEGTSGMSDSNSTFKFCPKCQCDTARNSKGKCQPCANQRMAKWRLKNPAKAKEQIAKWRAENPDKQKASADAWSAANKDRKKATTSAWIAANPEKVKATSAAWHAKNPNAKRIIDQNRRIRKRALGGSLSRGLTSRLFNLQKGKCPCCKQPLGDDYHVDHIMPLALGGAHVDSNIQLLRAVCNLQKNAKHPVDFMRQRGFLV